jgi:hypothetical protein
MFLPCLILIVSTEFLLFYFQVVCERILRRQFAQEYFRSIVNVNRLEFASVQKAIEDFGSPVEYARLTVTLRCDFLVLTYLLKNATNVNQRCTCTEHLLMFYFRVVFASLAARHWLRWRENSAVLKLTAILQYFANVVGERISSVRVRDMTVSDFLTI